MSTESSRAWARRMLDRVRAENGGELPKLKPYSMAEIRQMIRESYPLADPKAVEAYAHEINQR